MPFYDILEASRLPFMPALAFEKLAIEDGFLWAMLLHGDNMAGPAKLRSIQ